MIVNMIFTACFQKMLESKPEVLGRKWLWFTNSMYRVHYKCRVHQFNQLNIPASLNGYETRVICDLRDIETFSKSHERTSLSANTSGIHAAISPCLSKTLFRRFTGKYGHKWRCAKIWRTECFGSTDIRRADSHDIEMCNKFTSELPVIPGKHSADSAFSPRREH